MTLFVNYRRTLSQSEAELLATLLKKSFGDRRVFIDVSGLDGGQHWLQALEKQVDAASVMVVVICLGWADCMDGHNGRRIDDPSDFVRFEIARALSRPIPVLPVVLDGAVMPSPRELPGNLSQLAFFQALPFRAATRTSDAERIASRLRALIAASRPRGVPWKLVTAIGAACLLAGAAFGPPALGLAGVLPSGVGVFGRIPASSVDMRVVQLMDQLTRVAKERDAAVKQAKDEEGAQAGKAAAAVDAANAKAADAAAQARAAQQAQAAAERELAAAQIASDDQAKKASAALDAAHAKADDAAAQASTARQAQAAAEREVAATRAAMDEQFRKALIAPNVGNAGVADTTVKGDTSQQNLAGPLSSKVGLRLSRLWLDGNVSGTDNIALGRGLVKIRESGTGYSIYIMKQLGFTCTLEADASGNPSKLRDCTAYNLPRDSMQTKEVVLVCSNTGLEIICAGSYELISHSNEVIQRGESKIVIAR